MSGGCVVLGNDDLQQLKADALQFAITKTQARISKGEMALQEDRCVIYKAIEMRSDILAAKVHTCGLSTEAKKIKCEHCREGVLEQVKGDAPWSVDHLQCPLCDSTYNKEEKNE